MSIFGNNNTPYGTEYFDWGDDIVYASRVSYSPASDGTADSISIFHEDLCPGGPGAPIKFALYDASDNSLVGATEEGATVSSGGWFTLNFTGTVNIYSSKKYYIAFWHNTNCGLLRVFRIDNNDKARAQIEPYDGNFPDPISWNDSSFDAEFYIYCTYTPKSTVNYEWTITSDSSTVSLLYQPELLEIHTSQNIDTYIFGDGTDVEVSRGKNSDGLTLRFAVTNDEDINPGTIVNNIGSIMDSQETITLSGLDDTNLNTEYHISDLNFRREQGMPSFYTVDLSLERLYDKLG